MQKFESLVDPPCQEVWNNEDDLRLRKSVQNIIFKNWELLKVCRDIIDENTPMVNSLSAKEKIKESLDWEEKRRKEYENWKLRNLKTLNLKESRQKASIKSGPFENFCKKKGLERKKEMWEMRSEKEIEEKEEFVKDLKLERKGAKSKKRKLHLYKKCRILLEENVLDWKKVREKEEETLFQEMKKNISEERRSEKIGREPKELMVLEEARNKEEKLQRVSKLVTKFENCNVNLAETLFAPVAINLSCRTQELPSRATDCGEMKQITITKPQPVYRPGRAAEAPGDTGTGPPHQWERSSGDRDERQQPASQWERSLEPREKELD
jgi:hypothetical protein